MNSVDTTLTKLLLLAAMLGLPGACAPATATPLVPTINPSAPAVGGLGTDDELARAG